MLWSNLGIVIVLGVAMVGKNMDSEPGSTLLSTKGEKDLIARGLVWYYVNLGYGKFVEQFVMPKLYNELNVDFVAIKVSVLYHYPYLFKLHQVGGWLQSHVFTCWTCKCLPKLLKFINMSACQVTPKDSDRTSKGWQDVFYIYYGGKWPNK